MVRKWCGQLFSVQSQGKLNASASGVVWIDGASRVNLESSDSIGFHLDRFSQCRNTLVNDLGSSATSAKVQVAEVLCKKSIKNPSKKLAKDYSIFSEGSDLQFSLLTVVFQIATCFLN